MNKYILKTIIIGDPYVGKSNILSRLYNDTFQHIISNYKWIFIQNFIL